MLQLKGNDQREGKRICQLLSGIRRRAESGMYLPVLIRKNSHVKSQPSDEFPHLHERTNSKIIKSRAMNEQRKAENEKCTTKVFFFLKQKKNLIFAKLYLGEISKIKLHACTLTLSLGSWLFTLYSTFFALCSLNLLLLLISSLSRSLALPNSCTLAL